MTNKQRKIHMITAWACIIVWGIFAVTLSRQDGNTTSELSYGLSERLTELLNDIGITLHVEILNIIIRKAAHILIFLVLGGLMYYALAYTFWRKARLPLILSSLLCLVASSLDEIQKLFVAGRHCDPEEILLNSIASIIGVFLSYIFSKYSKQQ